MWKESIWRSPCEGSDCPVDTAPLSPKPPGQAGSPAAGIGTLGVCEGARCGTCGVHAIHFSPAFFPDHQTQGARGGVPLSLAHHIFAGWDLSRQPCGLWGVVPPALRTVGSCPGTPSLGQLPHLADAIGVKDLNL